MLLKKDKKSDWEIDGGIWGDDKTFSAKVSHRQLE